MRGEWDAGYLGKCSRDTGYIVELLQLELQQGIYIKPLMRHQKTSVSESFCHSGVSQCKCHM